MIPGRIRWFVQAVIVLLIWQTVARAEDGVAAVLPEGLPRAFPADALHSGARGLHGRERMVEVLSLEGEHLGFGARQGSGREHDKGIASRLFLSAGAALACGAVAWWSKEKADRAYGKYMHSASLRRQEKQFDRSERFDRIAGTAFVGMEAGLALTTYLLFF